MATGPPARRAAKRGVNAASPKAGRASGVKHALRSKIGSKGIPETERLASKVRYLGFLASLGMSVETFV